MELRDVGEDKKVAGFLLAVNRGAREAGADFVGCRSGTRQAELCAEYLTKGRQVGVEGYLRSHNWEEEGKRRRSSRSSRSASTSSVGLILGA